MRNSKLNNITTYVAWAWDDGIDAASPSLLSSISEAIKTLPFLQMWAWKNLSNTTTTLMLHSCAVAYYNAKLPTIHCTPQWSSTNLPFLQMSAWKNLSNTTTTLMLHSCAVAYYNAKLPTIHCNLSVRTGDTSRMKCCMQASACAASQMQ
jgi:hypothetical protein